MAMDETYSRRRLAVGVSVMTGIALLLVVTEYLVNGDYRRLLAKLITHSVGIPLVVVWATFIFRFTVRRRVSTVYPLLVGAFISGLLYSGLLLAVWVAGVSIDLLRPRIGVWSPLDATRVGFMMGSTNFALWALAFVFPFAAEDARVRALEADKLRSEAELAQLRAHLEPHFLLNTLNAIAGLITADPRQARRLIAALGDLLRDSLRKNGEIETLEDQIDWLRRYAKILEVRHAGQLAFHWQVQDETRRARLPRLLLQPLLENAINHGALMRQGGGEVTISTNRNHGRLLCAIADNGPGVVDGATRPDAFGFASVRRRLALRYGDAANVKLESLATGARSIVELPYEE